jgi:hypothetical protein
MTRSEVSTRPEVRLRRGWHADPGNWEVPAYVAGDFATQFVYERAKIAHAQNKPFIMEETGKGVSQQNISRTESASLPA